MSVRTVLLLLVAAILLVAVVGSVAWWRAGDTPVLSSARILEVDLTQPLPEDLPPESLALSFIERRPRLREVVSALHRASHDPRVVGVLAKVGSSPGGLATIQELRDSLDHLRENGKKTLAYAETFGESGPADGAYYLATAFDQVFLQPSGDVGLVGLRYEVPFVAGSLEKLGLLPQLGKRHEYKNAVNSYTEKAFTPAHAEAMRDLADSQFEQIVRGIAERRGFTNDEVRELIDSGPHLGSEALELRLVDRLAYRDEVYEAVESDWGADLEFEDLVSYGRDSRTAFTRDATVALIYGVGAISRGKGGFDPFTGSAVLGADTVAQAFRDAVDDADVRAILFRVNSPGGSYVASDTIWRETVRAREAGKPVIASFGDIAGSGGYFVAMNADRIIAQPGTITGSIGVYGGKMVSRNFWNKLGMTFDAVATSENAEMYSGIEEYDERGWQRIEASLDRIYDDFVGKVARGRGLDPAAVERVARGRIWTGEKALERGLVDELGGFRVAYDAIRDELGLPEGSRLGIRVFPKPKSAWEVFFERMSGLEGGASGWLGQISSGELRSVLTGLYRAYRGREVLEMAAPPAMP